MTTPSLGTRTLHPHPSIPSGLSIPSPASRRTSEDEKEQFTLPRTPSPKPPRFPNLLTPSSLSPRPLSPSSKAFTSGLLSSTAGLRPAPLVPADPHWLADPYHLRVSAVLLQCLEHLSLVSTLLTPPSSSSSSPSASSSSSPLPSLDLYTLLNHHQQLSALFSSLHAHRSHLSGLSNRAKLLSLQTALTHLSRQLTSSIQSMSSQLQLTVDDRGQDKKNRADLDHLTGLLRRARDQLTSAGEGGGGAYDGMWRDVREEEARALRVRQAKEQTERAAATIASLQAQLSSEESAYQSALAALQAQVADAHAALRHHRSLITHTVKYDQHTLAARAEATSRQRRARLAELSAGIAELGRRARDSARAHRYVVTYLGWVKGGVEREVGEWGERYEGEVGNDRERYGELMGKRAEEVRGLVGLQREWEEDEGRRREELREREDMEREERERREGDERRERSARKIQFAWRVYWRRRRVQLKKLQKQWQKQRKAQEEAEGNTA